MFTFKPEPEPKPKKSRGRGGLKLTPPIKCPRCGALGSLYSNTTPHNTYYYIYHGVDSRGKPKRCYVGPADYKYVTKLHDFGLQGAHQFGRYINYLDDIVNILVEKAKTESKYREKILSSLERINRRLGKTLSEIK